MVNAPRTVKDVPAQEFVISLAQYFRSSGKVRNTNSYYFSSFQARVFRVKFLVRARRVPRFSINTSRVLVLHNTNARKLEKISRALFERLIFCFIVRECADRE